MKTILTGIAVFTLMLLSSCNSAQSLYRNITWTNDQWIEYRIQKDADYFKSLKPERQKALKAGKIDIGYEERMIRIALGEPDRKYMKKTAEYSYTVWEYVKSIRSSDRETIHYNTAVKNKDGKIITIPQTKDITFEKYKEIVTLKLFFENGILSEYEELQ